MAETPRVITNLIACNSFGGNKIEIMKTSATITHLKLSLLHWLSADLSRNAPEEFLCVGVEENTRSYTR